MMKKIASLIVLLLAVSHAPGHASIINFSYTGDNNVTSFALYDASGSQVYDFLSAMGADDGNWHYATTGSQNLVLTPGSAYTLAWGIENYDGPTTESNPVAFLGQYSIDNSSTFFTDATWYAGTSLFSQLHATNYGFNGAPNIWTSVLGHAVYDISTSASWIGFGDFPGTAQAIYLSTTFTVPVDDFPCPVATPEPGTMVLVGLGLTGLSLLGKRRMRPAV